MTGAGPDLSALPRRAAVPHASKTAKHGAAGIVVVHVRANLGQPPLEKQYGVSLVLVNSFTLMASQSGDWVAADAAFKRIGDNWNEETWTTEARFKQNRDTAAQAAPMQIQARAIKKEAQDNMQTPEGEAYRKNVEQKLA